MYADPEILFCSFCVLHLNKWVCRLGLITPDPENVDKFMFDDGGSVGELNVLRPRGGFSRSSGGSALVLVHDIF